jgi:hypothetical protein
MYNTMKNSRLCLPALVSDETSLAQPEKTGSGVFGRAEESDDGNLPAKNTAHHRRAGPLLMVIGTTRATAIAVKNDITSGGTPRLKKSCDKKAPQIPL